MRIRDYYFVKVFPEVGPIFCVGVPQEVEDVDLFLDDHLKNVESWEPVDG